MTSYIYSKWLTAPIDCPVEFYSELDVQRYETRKIERFKDGRIGYASLHHSTPGTRLGIEPVPSLIEIRSQPEFTIEEIHKEDFEKQWTDATVPK